MRPFDIQHARNAPFVPSIDADLMALAAAITGTTFPLIQDYRDLAPGEPDRTGHLGPAAVRTSLHLSRPRYNLMAQLLAPYRGARTADISPGFGFLDVVL